MKLFNQLVLILGVWALGEYISSFIQNIVIVPGSIVGMILLFILLKANIIKVDKLEDIGNLLLDNMDLFFIPAGVSLIRSLGLIEKNVFVLLITIFFSTILVMYITGIVVEKMIKNKVKEN